MEILFIKNITILIVSLLQNKVTTYPHQKSQLYLQEQSNLFPMKKAI